MILEGTFNGIFVVRVNKTETYPFGDPTLIRYRVVFPIHLTLALHQRSEHNGRNPRQAICVSSRNFKVRVGQVGKLGVGEMRGRRNGCRQLSHDCKFILNFPCNKSLNVFKVLLVLNRRKRNQK